MPQSEQAARAAQRESAHQRWADDGGFVPEPEAAQVPPATRSPWLAVGAAATLGFVFGWLFGPRRPGT